ncbi:MAG TPA: helix-turn-helix domain-containing protein, partial [Phenylobacterium sp.]
APTSAIVWAARELHRRSGSTLVSDLAASVELGVRQFERRFRREIGMSPKLYARVVRFEAALRAKAAQPKTQWTEIAHGLGYFDQMHMVHDFNRLSGESPSLIWDQLDMFVKPEVHAGDRPSHA